ncbi:MAG: PDZ domain-containing protein [Myxococcaceae bacterium]|nr:PDZ domain-containing protein [Myxococcaceae bacterium]
MPPTPPTPLRLEVRWSEQGQPRRWFLRLTDWQTVLWLCDESEVELSRGPYRLRAARLPRAGAVTLFIERAPAASQVTVRTVRRGAPVSGVHVSLTGCEPLATGDGGVGVTSCEEIEEARMAVVRAPWRSATQAIFARDATEVTVAVLGRDEVEPGRVGLGFSRRTVTPTVESLADQGPAQRAGVRVGDELLEVNGVGVATVDEAMPLVVGAPGSSVRLKVRRGVDVLLLDVPRAPE